MHISDLGYKFLLKVYSHWSSALYSIEQVDAIRMKTVVFQQRGFIQKQLIQGSKMYSNKDSSFPVLLEKKHN